nr:hypothetical protein [Tanacetum cinerariifolium]
MLMGRTAMQKMGIVVSTIHGAIKFYTKKGARTALSVGEAEEETMKTRRTLTISKQRIPSCDDTKEKIIVNDKHDRNSENHHGQRKTIQDRAQAERGQHIKSWWIKSSANKSKRTSKPMSMSQSSKAPPEKEC